MGNTVPQRMCREAGTAVVRRPKSFTAGKQRRDEEGEATPAGLSRGGVPRAGGGDATTVVMVKIVLKRKDAEALVARLNAQSATKRKVRMAELKGELRASGDGCGGGSPASCQDEWRPRLAPIHEN